MLRAIRKTTYSKLDFKNSKIEEKVYQQRGNHRIDLRLLLGIVIEVISNFESKVGPSHSDQNDEDLCEGHNNAAKTIKNTKSENIVVNQGHSMLGTGTEISGSQNGFGVAMSVDELN